MPDKENITFEDTMQQKISDTR